MSREKLRQEVLKCCELLNIWFEREDKKNPAQGGIQIIRDKLLNYYF